MTTDEKLAVLARSIIQMSKSAATTWDYDGNVETTRGIDLDEECALKEIAKGETP